jgi:hypothetical protein
MADTVSIPSWTIRHRDRRKAIARQKLNTMEMELITIEKHLPIIKVTQSDFAHGTYRIKTPARYVIQEDISFNPNPSTYNISTAKLEGPDWMPTLKQITSGEYPVAPNGPYHMGFFAAFTIETDNVVIDLNGFTIEQHMEHYLQQRFFSIVELAPTPFIHGQGPSNFGPFQKHKNIKIHNGTMGLSSHEAIHGNGTENLIIEDLMCYDYEQAAIALNGGSLIKMKNIQLERNSRDALVRATYSQGRFIRSFLRRIIAEGDPTIDVNGTSISGSEILSSLETEMDSVYNDIINRKIEPTSVLFRNPDPVNTCDGSVYGIVLNMLGAAVGPFISTSDHKSNRLISLENVSLCGLNSNPVEVPALCVPEDHNKAQRGPVGDVIRIQMCTGDRGEYVSDALTNAQLYWNKYARLIGTTSHASPGIYDDWASGSKTLQEVMTKENICFMYGRDAMSHIMKGNIGLFLSGTSDTTLKSVHMQDIQNRGTASEGGDHDNYEGNRTRGFAITACKDVFLSDIASSSLVSTTADVYGVDFIHPCSDITLNSCSVINMRPALFVNAPNHQGHCDSIRGKSLVSNLVIT